MAIIRERANLGQVQKALLAMMAKRDTLNLQATLALLAVWGRKPEQGSLGTCQNLVLANCCERRQSRLSSSTLPVLRKTSSCV